MKIEATATPKGWGRFIVLIMNRLRMFTLNIDITITHAASPRGPMEDGESEATKNRRQGN